MEIREVRFVLSAERKDLWWSLLFVHQKSYRVTSRLPGCNRLKGVRALCITRPFLHSYHFHKGKNRGNRGKELGECRYHEKKIGIAKRKLISKKKVGVGKKKVGIEKKSWCRKIKIGIGKKVGVRKKSWYRKKKLVIKSNLARHTRECSKSKKKLCPVFSFLSQLTHNILSKG